MKTITIKNPYADLIVRGIKDIENRTWKTNFRGTVLIHAAATWHSRGKNIDNLFTPDQIKVLMEKDIESVIGQKKPFSAIIGQVDIIDCVINHSSFWAEKKEPELWDEKGNPIFDKPIYNWVLKNAVMYDQPILNVKGKLSFWDFDPY